MKPNLQVDLEGFIEDPIEDSYKDAFGDEVIVSKVGCVSIVHMDHPSKGTIKRRINEVIREELTGSGYGDGCPSCERLRKRPHDVVCFRP